eukprot:gnl/MRDRNA2_/MRDRNA2_136969_c0_seq1.p1 gnl/MRDRNA2_/MRDRNA2_136969_c0~~gnl/MRDRNA2_/MRDRNA2_136969_c0_seq1.p1  ORF type:complete len:236 (+),score=46.58 gnl/MRDRNA2_/MRDRNA2_136969_c0_seq1:112-819(+)
MEVPASIEFEGKELQLWRSEQLENISNENLRRRALDMRDVVGMDRVPPLPRHQDGMIKWIMNLQAAVTQLSPQDFGMSTKDAANYQEAPPTPSSQRPTPSPSSSKIPDSIEFEGKKLPLWRFEQLSNSSAQQLRTRALDLRDAVGSDRMPPLPRHHDGVVEWIMNAQSVLSQVPPEAFGMRQDAGDVQGHQQAPSSQSFAAPRDGQTESDQAYLDARAVRKQAQARNRGEGNPLW